MGKSLSSQTHYNKLHRHYGKGKLNNDKVWIVVKLPTSFEHTNSLIIRQYDINVNLVGGSCVKSGAVVLSNNW